MIRLAQPIMIGAEYSQLLHVGTRACAGPSRRIMIRLAQPIMIGWVAALAQHFVPKEAPLPFILRPTLTQSCPYVAAYSGLSVVPNLVDWPGFASGAVDTESCSLHQEEARIYHRSDAGRRLRSDHALTPRAPSLARDLSSRGRLAAISTLD